MTRAGDAEPFEGRLRALQAMRFVAALLVVLYHANIFVSASLAPAQRSLLAGITEVGRAGVPIFVVISGFIMLHTNAEGFGTVGAARRFIVARRADLPALPDQPAGDGRAPPLVARTLAVGPPDALGTLLLLPGDADRTLTVAWTLAFEMYFYLLFAVALTLNRTAGLAFLATVMVAGGAIGQAQGLEAERPSGEALYGAELPLFLAGVAIGLAARTLRGPTRASRPPLAALLALTGAGLLAASPLVADLPLPAIVRYGPSAILLVGSAVLADRIGRSWPVLGALAPLGDSSYSLYLTHILVMALLGRTGLAPIVGPWAWFAILVVASVAVGHLLHVVIERPIQGSLRRLLRSPLVSVPAGTG